MEALAGLYLELGKDDTSSVLADKCIEMLRERESEFGGDGRGRAIKGLVELVLDNLQSAESVFQKFSLAKELYQSIIEQASEMEDVTCSFAFGTCNMSQDEVLLGAMCALGQIEAQSGNFGETEVMLTKVLTKTEEHFGCHHPKVGVVLTCLAQMLRQKSMHERSSSLLIQDVRLFYLLKATFYFYCMWD